VTSVVRSVRLRSFQSPKNPSRNKAAGRLARALLLIPLVAGCAELSGDPATAGNAPQRRRQECENRANRNLDPYTRDTQDRKCKVDEWTRARK
jgi:hypothetical protein